MKIVSAQINPIYHNKINDFRMGLCLQIDEPTSRCIDANQTADGALHYANDKRNHCNNISLIQD